MSKKAGKKPAGKGKGKGASAEVNGEFPSFLASSAGIGEGYLEFTPLVQLAIFLYFSPPPPSFSFVWSKNSIPSLL